VEANPQLSPYADLIRAAKSTGREQILSGVCPICFCIFHIMGTAKSPVDCK